MRNIILVFLTCVISINNAIAQPLTITRGPYLQVVTHHSIIMRWRTNVACPSQVNYGTDINYGYTVNNNVFTNEHRIEIQGLQPATKYYYSIGTPSQTLQGEANNYFVTAPLPGSVAPVRLWVTGDFGNSSVQQLSVRDAFVAYTQNQPANLWLWLGDNAYSNGTDTEYQNNVFDKYPEQLKNIPVYPAIGNHDYSNAGYHSGASLGLDFPYFYNFDLPQQGEVGGVASGTPKYYSFNYANIHAIALDSYGAYNDTASNMYKWLENDLASNFQRWTIVYFHHPPYTKGSHDSDWEIELVDIRKHIVPLLERYGVDVVLSGHSHCNERTALISGHYDKANTFTTSMYIDAGVDTLVKKSPFRGTLYAVCGTSGQSPGATQPGFPMACMQYNNITDNCSLVLDVEDDLFTGKYLSSNGNVVNTFIIKKTGNLQQGPVTADGENNFTVSYTAGKCTLSYFLEQEATVQIDLINGSGQQINNVGLPTEKQRRGYYRLELNKNAPTLSAGMYILRMKADDKIYTQKIFIE